MNTRTHHIFILQYPNTKVKNKQEKVKKWKYKKKRMFQAYSNHVKLNSVPLVGDTQ